MLVEAGRAARRVPVVLAALAEGSVTVTSIRLLAPHFTEDNHRELLDAARHKSQREVELLVATLQPKPPVATVIRRLPGVPSPKRDIGSAMTDLEQRQPSRTARPVNSFRNELRRHPRRKQSTFIDRFSDICGGLAYLPPRPRLPGDQRLDAIQDVVTDRPDPLGRLPLRVVERPVDAQRAWHYRTLVATPHRDEHLRLIRDLRRQPGHGRIREVDPDLQHRVDDFRMDCGPGIGSGGDRPRLGGIREHVEPGRGHLGSAGIVDAREQHGLHRGQFSDGCFDKSISAEQCLVWKLGKTGDDGQC
jgi:hypothetical protein